MPAQQPDHSGFQPVFSGDFANLRLDPATREACEDLLNLLEKRERKRLSKGEVIRQAIFLAIERLCTPLDPSDEDCGARCERCQIDLLMSGGYCLHCQQHLQREAMLAVPRLEGPPPDNQVSDAARAQLHADHDQASLSASDRTSSPSSSSPTPPSSDPTSYPSDPPDADGSGWPHPPCNPLVEELNTHVWRTWKKAKLVEACKARGIPHDGTAKVLVQRLTDWLNES